MERLTGVSFEFLKKAASEDRLVHLLLFHGSGAKERIRAVLELALMLNCKEKNRPCGKCSACKKISSGNHPDIHIIKPLKTSIGIEQVLSLQGKIYRKTYEGRYRVCLIEEANKLTLPAANALLKIAEEPPENTIIIFSAVNSEGIIETLRSRAQAVYFPPPNDDIWGDDREAYSLSGGDPDLARKIQDYGIEQVKEWLDKYLNIIETGDFLKTFELFPLEKEESEILLQLLAVKGKELVIKGKASPQFLAEIRITSEAIRRQVNHRLAMEVLTVKHIELGGTEIG